jgi:hypothetical protein
MSTPALNPLVEKIRAMHPGTYDDMDDAALTKAVLAKYPQYSDLAAPAIAKPSMRMQTEPMSFVQQRAAQFGENNDSAVRHLAPIIKSAANEVYDVSTPAIATEIYKRLQGQPNELRKLPLKMVTAWLMSGGVPEGEAAAPEIAVDSAAEKAPALEKLATPEAAPAPKVTPKILEQQLNDALGGKALQPNVPLRQQVPVKGTAEGPKLPQGFTPVDSSALKGFKYDPQTREFETITQGGQRYVHGDVSPEDAQAFMDAESKGKAWQQIRGNPLVAKVVNGKRIAIKPRTDYGLSDLVSSR